MNYSQNWNCGHQDIKVINHKVTKDSSTVTVAKSKVYLAEVETEIQASSRRELCSCVSCEKQPD